LPGSVSGGTSTRSVTRIVPAFQAPISLSELVDPPVQITEELGNGRTIIHRVTSPADVVDIQTTHRAR